ncbi:histone-lysine N-methyltransferase SETMAR [Trichonephila clavipes]|nr:histone-lysine N-methyltransferase SETMAR [Trichonephila clavipes]
MVTLFFSKFTKPYGVLVMSGLRVISFLALDSWYLHGQFPVSQSDSEAVDSRPLRIASPRSLIFILLKRKCKPGGYNCVYGADTVTANSVKFWFRRFRSGIFDVKDAPRTGRAVVENVDKITEIIEIDRHVISCSIEGGAKDRP